MEELDIFEVELVIGETDLQPRLKINNVKGAIFNDCVCISYLAMPGCAYKLLNMSIANL